MTLDEIRRAAADRHLAIVGVVYDALPDGVGSLALLGPLEPGFWAEFTAAPEYSDGCEDPMNRWSERVIGDMANALDAKAFYPFGGPPYQPFIQWAQSCGQVHSSPVGLLVHDTSGMWVSFRGALGFGERIERPEPGPSPCETCADKPCLTACPVSAFASGEYDVAACKADLDRAENDCMTKGCAVRRACPISQSYGRLEEQSAFHMRAFR